MSAAVEESPVLVERRGPGGRLGVLTLNRPKAINALTHEMVTILAQALSDWAQDPAVETVLLTGAGERGLCAGGDIVSIHRDAVTGGDGSERFWRDEYDLNALIATYPKPYVAFMDGIVLGGGVGVSAHARHRVVTERTRIGMPETGIGFVPDVGGTWLLSRAPGELGTYVALTAGHVDAGDAIALGLADHHVLAADLPRLAVLLEDRSVSDALAHVVQPAPVSALTAQRSWIDATFAGDDVAAIGEALRARTEPEAAAAADRLARNSPTSLIVTLRALRAAPGLAGLEEALDQEYRIAVRMLRGHDFPEGVRAQVIDKDRNPRWRPATLAEVATSDVDAYFAPLQTTQHTTQHTSPHSLEENA
jgi:enoyl-CoA hydratase